jgi:hypothetical protein
MTLLLAARAQSHILLTADGRCTDTNRGVRTTTSDTLRKIFPIAHRPLALIHHGENVINGQPVSELLETFGRDNSQIISVAGSRQISLLLAQTLDALVSATLVRIADSKNCGFWVSGFDTEGGKPQIYEVIWNKESATEVNLRIMPHGDLLMGGDAAQFIKTFLTNPIDDHLSWDRIFAADIRYSQELHDELYRRAETAQQESTTDQFGGHKHQLAITKDGCEWLVPPIDTNAA